MTLPGFTAHSALPVHHHPWRGEPSASLEMDVVLPAQNPELDACLEGCDAVPTAWQSACAAACWAKYAYDVFGGSPTGPKTGPPDFPEYGAPAEGGATDLGLGGVAVATLIGIALGVFTGYEIEKHGGVFPPALPTPGIPTPTCGFATPGAPKTQHQITETSHLGCARSEALARVAADADCKTRTGLCNSGPCPTGTCGPYARVWNTATVTGISNPTGISLIDIFSSVANGCSTTAYYTCECGC